MGRGQNVRCRGTEHMKRFFPFDGFIVRFFLIRKCLLALSLPCYLQQSIIHVSHYTASVFRDGLYYFVPHSHVTLVTPHCQQLSLSLGQSSLVLYSLPTTPISQKSKAKQTKTTVDSLVTWQELAKFSSKNRIQRCPQLIHILQTKRNNKHLLVVFCAFLVPNAT